MCVTQLTAVALLLLRAQEDLQAPLVVHAVLHSALAPGGAEHRGGGAVAGPQPGTLRRPDAAGVGAGAGGGAVAQHLGMRNAIGGGWPIGGVYNQYLID